MELPSAFRTLVGGHRLLIAICIALPLAVVGLLAVRQPTLYSADARVQATDATLGSDTEADSVLNLVRGIATSGDVVHRALHDAGISNRNATYIAAHRITLTRLGSSPVIDLAVLDADPATAIKLAGALAGEVVTFLRDDSQQPQLKTMSQLRAQAASLATQRDRISAQLNAATNADDVRTLSTQLSNVEQQLTQTSGALQQLEVTTAAASSAAVIARPTMATRPPSSLVLRLVLAAFGGLVAGLLLAALREMLKPRVADARSAARQLDVPLLGKLTNGSIDPLTSLSVRRAAERAHVTTLAVAGRRDASTAAALTEQFLVRSLTASAHGSANGAANGSTSGSAGATTNGTAGGGAASRAGSGSAAGSISAATIAKLRQEPVTTASTTPLRAVALSEIAPLDLSEVVGLLVAVAPRMPAAALTRVRDVSVATGWPIVGVLDAGA
jgi:capsular polysaccharide biosynthesis protein